MSDADAHSSNKAMTTVSDAINRDCSIEPFSVLSCPTRWEIHNNGGRRLHHHFFHVEVGPVSPQNFAPCAINIEQTPAPDAVMPDANVRTSSIFRVIQGCHIWGVKRAGHGATGGRKCTELRGEQNAIGILR